MIAGSRGLSRLLLGHWRVQLGGLRIGSRGTAIGGGVGFTDWKDWKLGIEAGEEELRPVSEEGRW